MVQSPSDHPSPPPSKLLRRLADCTGGTAVAPLSLPPSWSRVSCSHKFGIIFEISEAMGFRGIHKGGALQGKPWSGWRSSVSTFVYIELAPRPPPSPVDPSLRGVRGRCSRCAMREHSCTPCTNASQSDPAPSTEIFAVGLRPTSHPYASRTPQSHQQSSRAHNTRIQQAKNAHKSAGNFGSAPGDVWRPFPTDPKMCHHD